MIIIIIIIIVILIILIMNFINFFILSLYDNKINARVLIGQSAMVYCAGKPMEKSRVF